MKNASTISGTIAFWRRIKVIPCFMLVRIESPVDGGINGLRIISKLAITARNDKPLSVKHQAAPNAVSGQASRHRPYYPGQIELDGIQGNGIVQVFGFNQRWEQGGIGWASESLRQAYYK